MVTIVFFVSIDAEMMDMCGHPIARSLKLNMEGFKILVNGEHVTNVGMMENGNFIVILTVGTRDGALTNPLELRIAGRASQNKEDREWLNLELSEFDDIRIVFSKALKPDEAAFRVFNPYPPAKDSREKRKKQGHKKQGQAIKKNKPPLK